MRFHRYGLLQPAPDRPRRSDDGTRSKFALSYEQVEAAHTAALEWYEGVIRTVNALQLQQELAVGFTEFKLRASGRYDMRVPALDAMPCFDAEAPWLPLVRRILGPDAVRIHLGCMLSLPGSVAQNWHMDGDHLSETVMHGPHCLNVFVPLVVRTHARTPGHISAGLLPSSILTGIVRWNVDRIWMSGWARRKCCRHRTWTGRGLRRRSSPARRPGSACSSITGCATAVRPSAPTCTAQHAADSLFLLRVALAVLILIHLMIILSSLTEQICWCRSVGVAQGFRTSRPSRAR